MILPLSQDQAVPPALQRLEHVTDDLVAAYGVAEEIPVDRRHPAGLRRICLTDVLVRRRMHRQEPLRGVNGPEVPAGGGVMVWRIGPS